MGQNSPMGPRHWKVEWTSNLLILILLGAILVNALLVFGFQVWFVYGLSTPEAALLSHCDAAVVDSAAETHMQSWLLEKPGGSYQLVTTEKHVFLDRYRVVKKGTFTVDENPLSKTVLGDGALVHITISGGRITQYQENSLALQIIRNGPRIPFAFLVYSLLLIVAEIAAVLLVRKIRGT